MGKLRARELGFDACMYMLHKTFGAAKGGGGPAVGAYGCTEELAPFLPGPLVTFDGERYRLDDDQPASVGKVREFWGNVQQVVKAYLWSRAMGADGIKEAADLSVLANNYMDKRILEIPGITRSNAQLDVPRMEMTRFSLGELQRETGIGVVDVANRLADYGIDGPWESHEPWLVPEPITPEAGEMWSKEDLDYWIDALAEVCREAREDPELVRTAPHNQVVHKLADVPLDEPDAWATTWRAWRRKHAQVSSQA
jgi:glycine dehydrogenase subunit 2